MSDTPTKPTVVAVVPILAPVASSYLAEIGHDGEAMFVRFRDKATGGAGSAFRYVTVSKDLHAELVRAESVGRAFLSLVRDKHKGVLVVAPT